MSLSPASLSIWESAQSVCSDAFAATVQWCGLLTDTQRLLLPTALAVVVLLWTKMCPPKVKIPSTIAEDEAIYTAAIERWLAASAADKQRCAETSS